MIFYYNILDLSIEVLSKLKPKAMNSMILSEIRGKCKNRLAAVRDTTIDTFSGDFQHTSSWWWICCVVFYLLFLGLSLGG